jgi:hypothetical protein
MQNIRFPHSRIGIAFKCARQAQTWARESRVDRRVYMRAMLRESAKREMDQALRFLNGAI